MLTRLLLAILLLVGITSALTGCTGRVGEVVAPIAHEYRDASIRWVYTPGTVPARMTWDLYVWRSTWSFCPIQPIIGTTEARVAKLEEGPDGYVIITEDVEDTGYHILGDKPKYAIDLETGERADVDLLAGRSADDVLLNEDPNRIPIHEDLLLRFVPEPRRSVFAMRNEGRDEERVLLWRRRGCRDPRLLLYLPKERVALLALLGYGNGEPGGYLVCIDLDKVEFIPGGGTADAMNEVRHASVHMETLDLDGLVEHWEDYYDKLAEEDRAILPLRRIAFLAPPVE